MSGPTYRRRIVVVDRKFQLGMSGRVVSYLAAYFLFFFLLAVFAPFLGSVLDGASHEQTTAALTDLVTMSQRLVMPLFLTFVCLALHTVLLTHRIAGPVYRFRKMFEGVGEGNIARDVKLRKGDFLDELAQAYNTSMVKLRTDIDDLRAEAQALLADDGETEGTNRERGEKLLQILERYHTGEEETETQSEPATSAEPAPAPVAEC
jgi:methyl-accepting chemotaxis protein